MAQRNNGHHKTELNRVGVKIPHAKKVDPAQVSVRASSSHLTLVSKKSLPKRLRSIRKTKKKKVDYVIDTSVIIFDPWAVTRFDEHNVHIPSKVLSELDNLKTSAKPGVSKSARDAVSYLSSQTDTNTTHQIKDGIKMVLPEGVADERNHSGRLFLDMTKPKIPDSDKYEIDWDHSSHDHKILMFCISLIEKGKFVVLVTRDINLRLIAKAMGIQVENYLNAVLAEEEKRSGYYYMPDDFWSRATKANFKSYKEDGVDMFEFTLPLFKRVVENELVVFPKGEEFIVVEKPSAHKVVLKRFKGAEIKGSGYVSRNLGQRLALHHMLDDSVELVSVAGGAGSGKTIAAVSVAFELVVQLQKYHRVIYIQPAVGPGEKIGFLPGTEEEKMAPWSAAIDDSLEALDFDSGQPGSIDYIKEKMNLQLKAINTLRGRSFGQGTVVIFDEIQNATREEVKTVVTRMCNGSKLICAGNFGQVDNGKLTALNNGMSILISNFFDLKEYAHVTLEGTQRNVIAAAAENRL